MMMRWGFYIILSLFIFSCGGDSDKFPQIDVKQLQENLLEANIRAMNKESKQIDEYIKTKKLSVTKTQTGLRYQIYEDIVGETIKKEQKVEVKYNVTLLNGTECYSTKEGTEVFTVGKDYVESGLHEGIQFMSVGDKAIIIMPSHLAHGLAGDMKKIPFKSTIVYDIELVAIK